MLNIEKYKEEIVQSFFEKLSNYGAEMSYDDIVYYALGEAYVRHTHDKSYSFEPIIDWLCEEYKEPILTIEEKEYLGNVIKPFKNNIRSIIIIPCSNSNLCFISIRIETNIGDITLPYFEKGTMYKGMKLSKAYTLEELGL